MLRVSFPSNYIESIHGPLCVNIAWRCVKMIHRYIHMHIHSSWIRWKTFSTRPYCPRVQWCKKPYSHSCCKTVFICMSHFHLLFLCELKGKHRSSASPEMLNLNIRKTNNICLLSNISRRAAARLEIPYMQAEQSTKLSRSHCDSKSESCITEFSLLQLSRHLWHEDI